METSKFNDAMHELICRDRYLLDSTQSGMWVRELYRDLPEAEVIKEWWGEHAPPDPVLKQVIDADGGGTTVQPQGDGYGIAGIRVHARTSVTENKFG